MEQNCIQDSKVENASDVTTISTLHIHDKLQCHQSEQIDMKHEIKSKDNPNTRRRRTSSYTGRHFNYINSFSAAAFEVMKWDSFHSEE
mmetsp:Transcript_17961/g.23256  ORF Transcript_17961/g.23256 Transcript_17961/m.23256 type:complete len:88 (+) Transcript_17961:691-954(+)